MVDVTRLPISLRNEQPDQNTRPERAERICRILEESLSVREVARGYGIGERTARKGVALYRTEDPSGLENCSSQPMTTADRTAVYWIGLIESLRREYRLTGDEIAGKLNLARPP